MRRGTPRSALDIMLNSLANKTYKQYDCALKSWWQFCSKFQLNPYQVSVPYILKFLSERFEAGASYGSLNTARSAIALIMGPKLGADDRVKRFFKGVFRSKPPTAKYDVTWDPGIVLSYLNSHYADDNLDLQKATKKLVTILALTTGHRVQTLSLIKIQNIKFTSDGIQITITDTIKTSSRNSLHPILQLKVYKNNLEICPVTIIKTYLKMTEPIRQNMEHLVLTFKRPYKNASSQSISRWIKSVLGEAGIDINMFSAHSTRHAATSAANRAGLSIDLIRKTAGWSKNSEIFARFYNRPMVEEQSFSSTICNLRRNH